MLTVVCVLCYLLSNYETTCTQFTIFSKWLFFRIFFEVLWGSLRFSCSISDFKLSMDFILNINLSWMWLAVKLPYLVWFIVWRTPLSFNMLGGWYALASLASKGVLFNTCRKYHWFIVLWGSSLVCSQWL
jgi:hypothetical protein